MNPIRHIPEIRVDTGGLTVPGRQNEMPQAGARSGRFTLLELILAMTLVVAVMAMTAPFLRAFMRSRESSGAATQIVALTRFARRQAIAEGAVFQLNYDLATGRFWVTRLDDAEYPDRDRNRRQGPAIRLPEDMKGVWEKPADLGESGWIPFYPDGRSRAVTLLLIDRYGREWRIMSPSPGEDFQVLS